MRRKKEQAVEVDTLPATVARLYDAFAGYRVPCSLDASPLRDAPAILAALRSAPLRQPTSEHLGNYAAWAMTTVGGPWDYAHFLPRIVELALDNAPYHGLDPWMIAGKVRYADERGFRGWPGWPDAQRSALRAVFMAAWRLALQSDPADEDAPRWLVGLAGLGPVADALQAWRDTASPHAARHLANLVSHHQEQLAARKQIGERGDKGVVASAQEEITAWLLQRETWQRLMEASTVDEYMQWQIEAARVVLWPAGEPRP